MSIPGGVINDGTTQMKHDTFFGNIAFVILAMGTNDIQRNGKNFEQKIKEDLIQQIKTCQRVYPAAQIILSEVLPQTTQQEWRVCVVNALIHRIGKMFQLKIFQPNISAKCSKYWFDDVHLSDEGLKLFMNKLENFANKLVLEGFPGSFSLNRDNFGGEVLSETKTSKVYDLVYKNFNPENFEKCIRILNGTAQIGCQSSESGNSGVLFLANTSARLNFFYQKPKLFYYIVLIEASLFNRSVIMQMMKVPIKGLLIYESESIDPPIWSPDLRCPSERVDIYNKTHGAKYSKCSNKWNPIGDGLTEENIPFPIFFLKNATERDEFINCYNENNIPENYPLCAAEMKSFMYGASDTITCLRRGKIETSLKQEIYCQVIGGRNLISSLKTYANSSKDATPVILVTAPIDSRSMMMSDFSPGANEATGFISLLAIAQALGRLSKATKDKLKKDILFILFDAEAFDNIGSARLVLDMEAKRFPFNANPDRLVPPPIQLKDLRFVVELRQLGLVGNQVYIHFDPVSYNSSRSIKNSIDDVVSKLQNESSSSSMSFVKQSPELGLSPSSFASILKRHAMPGVVLTDYDRHFRNSRYFSRFDTLKNLNVNFPNNSTDEEVIAALRPLAEKLSTISTNIARTLYRIASDEDPLSIIKADPDTVGQLLFCYLHKSDCSLFRENIDYFAYNQVKKFLKDSSYFNRYSSVYSSGQVDPLTNVTKGILTRFIGTELSNSTPCSNPNPEDDRIVYDYLKGRNEQPVCVVSSTYQLPAYNPYAFQANIEAYAHFPGMWTESQWGSDGIRLRLFKVQNPNHELLILLAGVFVLMVSLLVVYAIDTKSHVLFRHDPSL